MKKLFVVFLFIIHFCFTSTAQEQHITDSLNHIIKTTKNDTDKTDALIILSQQYWYINPDTAYIIANKALKLSEKMNFYKGIAGALNSMGVCFEFKGDYPKALECYFKSLKTNEEDGNKRGIAASLNNIGIIYDSQGDYPKALEYFFRSLKIKEEIGNKLGIASSLNNVGNVHWNQGNYPKAREYYLKALKLYEEVGKKQGIANSLNNIGNIYFEQQNYPQALEYHFKSLKISKELKSKRGIANSMVNLGTIYLKQGKYQSALDYCRQSMEISEKIGAINVIKECAYNMSELYEKLGNPAKAFSYYKDYIAARDSLFNEENTKKTVQAEMRYEFEKQQQAERLEQEKKETLAKEKIKRQRIIIASVIAGLILVIVFAFFLYRRFRITKKQKGIIEKQNMKITDSITYAKRIQNAILPSASEFKQAFTDSFILYKPRDIVSGDFYWYATIKQNGDTSHMVAAADCTGHGVPGAFMSMIGNTLLNEIVNEKGINEPAEILNQLKEGVIKSLAQEDSQEQQKDGMDIALCKINLKARQLEYAGAYNPLYIIRKGELIEVKPNRFPVGTYALKETDPFTNHQLDIKEGDRIYIFSDGYVDQFGGEKGDKYTKKNFKELLIKIHKESMELQREKLEKEFEQWRGTNQQLDDVLILGVKV